MLCEKYQNLTVEQKVRMVGEVVHLIQNDNTFFELAQLAINKGERRGLLDGVTILPESINEPEY